MIDQMRRHFGHAPRVAGGAYATTFAGVRDQEIVLTGVTPGVGKAMGENAAVEIAAKLRSTYAGGDSP